MKSTQQKKIFLALIAMAAVVLSTLPLLHTPKDKLYVYTADKTLTSEERTFVRELVKMGFDVEQNSKKSASKDGYALWFAAPEYATKLPTISEAKYNFIYSDAYYPINWRNLKKSPIMLTPHQDLYEHYMRSNIKSAVLNIKENNAAERFNDIYQWLRKNL